MRRARLLALVVAYLLVTYGGYGGYGDQDHADAAANDFDTRHTMLA